MQHFDLWVQIRRTLLLHSLVQEYGSHAESQFLFGQKFLLVLRSLLIIVLETLLRKGVGDVDLDHVDQVGIFAVEVVFLEMRVLVELFLVFPFDISEKIFYYYIAS